MTDRLRHAVAFALYQLTVVVGILAMPVGLLLGRLGVSPPVDRVLRELGSALDGTDATA